MNWLRNVLFIGLILGGVGALGAALVSPWAAVPWSPERKAPIVVAPLADASIVGDVDAVFRQGWSDEGLAPAGRAADLAIMRRLSLALTGTIPSLEEIREFEARPAGTRIEEWVDSLLADRRFADYFAERFARAYVGTEDGPFIIFRRRRFVSWLSDQFHENRRYDAIVRDLIASDGLWTDHPATNFLTVTYDQDRELPDAERLAARTTRAFLGMRIDCAQCHDHPFQDWTQADFQGLAAYFGQTRSGFTGIHDDPDATFEPVETRSGQPKEVAPRVPFQPELLPGAGPPRVRLARWLTDPINPWLARATVNRVWALMFGRPLVDPVDDLESVAELPAALERLAGDFASHGHDLKRLIRVIARTEVFRLDSALEPDATPGARERLGRLPADPASPRAGRRRPVAVGLAGDHRR